MGLAIFAVCMVVIMAPLVTERVEVQAAVLLGVAVGAIALDSMEVAGGVARTQSSRLAASEPESERAEESFLEEPGDPHGASFQSVGHHRETERRFEGWPLQEPWTSELERLPLLPSETLCRLDRLLDLTPSSLLGQLGPREVDVADAEASRQRSVAALEEKRVRRRKAAERRRAAESVCPCRGPGAKNIFRSKKFLILKES